MTRTISIGVLFVLSIAVIAPPTAAQTVLDPTVDGLVAFEYGRTLATSETYITIANTTAGTLDYIIKFDITGLSPVVASRLVLFASTNNVFSVVSGIRIYNGGNQSGDPYAVTPDDNFTTLSYAGSPNVYTVNSTAFAASFDITDMLNADILAGATHSDYVVHVLPMAGGGLQPLYTMQGGLPTGPLTMFPIDHPEYAPHIDAQQIPEPGTLVLFGLGLLGLVAGRRRRKKAA